MLNENVFEVSDFIFKFDVLDIEVYVLLKTLFHNHFNKRKKIPVSCLIGKYLNNCLKVE